MPYDADPVRWAISTLLLVFACGDTAPVPALPDRPDPPEAAYISPEGDDAASGTRDAPFRTVAHALSTEHDHLILLPGLHTEGPLSIGRAVRLEGEDATIRGVVHAAGGPIHVQSLSIQGGLDAADPNDLLVENSTIAAVDREHAFGIARGSARLRSTTLECGTQTCLSSSGADVTVEGGRATTSTTTQRVFRIEGGAAAIRNTTIEGGAVAALQLEAGADVRIERSELGGGDNALVALDSTLLAEELVVTGARRYSLLLDSSTVDVRGGRYDGTTNLTVGISGGEVLFSNVSLGPSDFGVASVAPTLDRPARVRFEGGSIEHGAHAAILADGAAVAIAGTRLIGAPGIAGDDAVSARGAGARVTIEGAIFEDPSGSGISLYEGASGTISATITRPRLAGITVEGAEATVTISDSVIDGCQDGSGIFLDTSTTTLIRRVLVDGCSEAGVLSLGTAGTIEESHLRDNAQFGVAAFGGASLTVSNSTISGSPLATFATCGDGAEVLLRGDNRITGATTDCP